MIEDVLRGLPLLALAAIFWWGFRDAETKGANNAAFLLSALAIVTALFTLGSMVNGWPMLDK